MSESHHINLSKQTLPQLQDLLERQRTLMKNKNLLDKLKDKGESVAQLQDKILIEIQHRKELNNVEKSLPALDVGDSSNEAEFLKEEHVKYVCSKEKPIEDRYLPHRTLIHKQSSGSSSPEKSPKGKHKEKDVTAASEPKLIHEPTKLLPLLESLVIESEQAHRVMEEKAKKALSSLANDLTNYDDGNEDVDKDENQTIMLDE